MTQFNWLEWAVIILGISVFILGSFLMQVLNETQRQKQSVDTHSHQIKRLTGLVRDLEVKNRELREQVSESNDEAYEEVVEPPLTTVDDLLDEATKS